MSFAASGMIPASKVATSFLGFAAVAYVPYYFVNVRRVFGGAHALRALRRSCGRAALARRARGLVP